MPLTGLHTTWTTGSYQTDRDFLLKVAENNALRIDGITNLNAQFDGNNSIAIGYGFDLLVNDDNAIRARFTVLNQQIGSNVTLTEADAGQLRIARDIRTQLRAIDDQLKRGQITPAEAAQQKAPLIDELVQIAAELTIDLGNESAASRLLQNVANDSQNELDAFLADAAVADSKEKAVLVSMWYQTPAYLRRSSGGRTNLAEALANDKRAEAWYEIRYGSMATNYRASPNGAMPNRRCLDSTLIPRCGPSRTRPRISTERCKSIEAL